MLSDEFASAWLNDVCCWRQPTYGWNAHRASSNGRAFSGVFRPVKGKVSGPRWHWLLITRQTWFTGVASLAISAASWPKCSPVAVVWVNNVLNWHLNSNIIKGNHRNHGPMLFPIQPRSTWVRTRRVKKFRWPCLRWQFRHRLLGVLNQFSKVLWAFRVPATGWQLRAFSQGIPEFEIGDRLLKTAPETSYNLRVNKENLQSSTALAIKISIPGYILALITTPGRDRRKARTNAGIFRF